METLTRVWIGEVKMWNDPRIVNLNPELASNNKLPAAPIKISYLSKYFDSFDASICTLVCELTTLYVNRQCRTLGSE